MSKFLMLFAAVAFAGTIAAEEGGAPAGEGKAKEKPAKMALEAIIQHADADKDGAISAEELKAVTDEAQNQKLVALDTNKDGTIDATEIAAAPKKQPKAPKPEKAEKPKKEGEAAH